MAENEAERRKRVFSGVQPSGGLHLGNYLGARYAIRGGSKRIRLVMFLVLALLFVKTILSFTGVIDF